jgi:hypothetical protein
LQQDENRTLGHSKSKRCGVVIEKEAIRSDVNFTFRQNAPARFLVSIDLEHLAIAFCISE